MEDYRHLRIQEVHVTLIRFADERLLDPVREIPEVGQELLRLADEGRTNLVLNFAGVDRVSSMFYSQLLALRKRLQTCGARLTLTNLCPFVQEIFRAFQADKLFDIRTDEADALPRKV
jgi:anti-anti-sigma regulatory factor